jgi:hypothetical protein
MCETHENDDLDISNLIAPFVALAVFELSLRYAPLKLGFKEYLSTIPKSLTPARSSKNNKVSCEYLLLSGRTCPSYIQLPYITTHIPWPTNKDGGQVLYARDGGHEL